MERSVGALEQVESERRRQRRHADERFGNPEPDKRAAHAIGDAAANDAAERQSGHEHGPDRARSVHRDAEDQPDQPEPQHLIDEGAGAGEEEDRCQ